MRRLMALIVTTALTAALPLAAQNLTYTSTSSMVMGGALGTMMSFIPGAGDPTVDTTYIKGSLIRTNSGGDATIMDWAEGVITSIDHEARTYTSFTLSDMMEAMSGANAMAGAAQRPADEADANREDREPQFEVKFSTDRTGRSERVGGYRAEQVILTMELVPIEGAEEMEGQQTGNIAIITEMWMSTEFPEYQLFQEMSGEMAESLRSQMGGMDFSQMLAGAQGFDPRMQEAWEENAKALSELEGQALRTVLNFVMVPPEAELDRDQVLAMADDDLSSGAGGAAAAGAADAARQALSGLAGRFGRGRKEEPKEEAPAQSVFMRVTTEIDGVSEDDLDPALFEVPEGYTERVFEMPVRG